MTIPLRRVGLGPGVDAWFTGRPDDEPAPPVGQAGNLSHRRPHLPDRLASDRADVLGRMNLDSRALAWMDQVHGAAVAAIDKDTPAGVQVPGVDGLVTDQPGRALVVQSADCVPVLLRAGQVVGAVHAGRKGIVAGVIGATIDRIRSMTDESIQAAIGPAIGGCCYEVPADLREQVATLAPGAASETTWGTPSLDLPAAVRDQLSGAGVEIRAEIAACTRHDDGWFSHRRDPAAGRQLSLVVRWP